MPGNSDIAIIPCPAAQTKRKKGKGKEETLNSRSKIQAYSKLASHRANHHHPASQTALLASKHEKCVLVLDLPDEAQQPKYAKLNLITPYHSIYAVRTASLYVQYCRYKAPWRMTLPPKTHKTIQNTGHSTKYLPNYWLLLLKQLTSLARTPRHRNNSQLDNQMAFHRHPPGPGLGDSSLAIRESAMTGDAGV